MKKFTLLAALALAGATPCFAQDLVKNLFTDAAGRSVDWGNTLTIDAAQFAEGVEVGNFIQLDLAWAKEAVELKSDGTWLPGTILTNYGEGQDNVTYKVYLTTAGLDALKATGLEICGGGMTVKSVDVMSDGFVMPEGAIWGGYFWIENWNTLELFKPALAAYDSQKYMTLNFAPDKADYTNYVVNVLTQWDTPEFTWATGDQVTKFPLSAQFELKASDVNTFLEGDKSALMVQLNPEGQAPFNMTSIVLSNDLLTSQAAIEAVQAVPTDYYTVDGVKVREAAHGLYLVRYSDGSVRKVIR